jgi:hypothetical protein
MAYSVACECSRVHPVSVGDAGSTLTCTCGRNVSVPSLSVLRQQAGEFTASPEMILDSMLRNSELPGDPHCVVCHTSTDDIRHFKVVCERAEAKKELGGCGYLAYMVFFGWVVGLFLAMKTNEEAGRTMHGRNVHYRLPLRLCHGCDSKRDEAGMKELLSYVPVYEHLLNKYPHATISAV